MKVMIIAFIKSLVIRKPNNLYENYHSANGGMSFITILLVSLSEFV